MPEGNRVYSIKSKRHDDRQNRDVWYTVGTMTLFPDGGGRMRLHAIPDQEYYVYAKEGGDSRRDNGPDFEGVEGNRS